MDDLAPNRCSELTMKTPSLLLAALLIAGSPCRFDAASAADLTAWRDSASKRAIIEFVDKVTRQDSPEYVPSADRIAAFDDDGTLWTEQPLSAQFAFAVDRVTALSPQHPEWYAMEPFASILRGNMQAALAAGDLGLQEVLRATRAGMTSEDFEAVVREWIATARHPETGRLYTEMAYKPMLELFAFLKDHDFKTFIVSRGDTEFMRIFSERVFNVSSQQVIGVHELRFDTENQLPVSFELLTHSATGEKRSKFAGRETRLKRRPIAAFGNSDDDIQMLQWATAGEGVRLGLLVHHTDAQREWAYDVITSTGKLDNALDRAQANDWTIVDMRTDWKVVFSFEER
jgi:hypothetical protein